MSKNELTQVLDELDVCAKLMALWVILKGGQMCGRVTARYSRSGGTTYITFQMFGWVVQEGLPVLCGYERVSGWGFNRTATGITEILARNRERLKEEYGIELSGQDWEIQGRWEKDIAAAGYKVVRVI